MGRIFKLILRILSKIDEIQLGKRSFENFSELRKPEQDYKPKMLPAIPETRSLHEAFAPEKSDDEQNNGDTGLLIRRMISQLQRQRAEILSRWVLKTPYINERDCLYFGIWQPGNSDFIWKSRFCGKEQHMALGNYRNFFNLWINLISLPLANIQNCKIQNPKIFQTTLRICDNYQSWPLINRNPTPSHLDINKSPLTMPPK